MEFVGRRILERHHRAVAGAEATLEYGGDAVEDFSGEEFCPNHKSESEQLVFRESLETRLFGPTHGRFNGILFRWILHECGVLFSGQKADVDRGFRTPIAKLKIERR